MGCYQDCKDGKDGMRVVEATSTTIVIYGFPALKVRLFITLRWNTYLSLHIIYYIESF